MIRTLGLSGFFLLHHDMLELAREVAVEVRGASSARRLLPPGRGRGSSVSSIVCYLTGLSHIDPIRNKLLLGRFLNEEITSLPDIDLDFPRDIREKLIPRVHERYGTERAALVAAFATYRWKGVIRDLGKALGLPAGEIERVARSADVYGDADDFRRGVEEAIGAAARGLGALAGADRAGPGGLRAAAPRLPAPRRDGDLDRAADRPLPGAALGDGGPQPRAVGQGLLRGRRLPEDRPARAWGCCRRSSAAWTRSRACAASGSTSRASDYDDAEVYETIQQRRDDRRVPDREPRADADRCGARSPRTLDDLTVQVALVRPGPIQGGAVHPYIERRERLRADPDYQVPYAHPLLEPVLERDARRDRVPGPGAGGRDGARRLQRPARPRACGAR